MLWAPTPVARRFGNWIRRSSTKCWRSICAPGMSYLRAVVPVMLKQGNGAIVNVASRAAFDHAAGGAAYAASKAAAVAMIALLQPASRPRQTQWESAAGPREAMFEAGDHQPVMHLERDGTLPPGLQKRLTP